MENKVYTSAGVAGADEGTSGADAAMTGVMNALGQGGEFSHK